MKSKQVKMIIHRTPVTSAVGFVLLLAYCVLACDIRVSDEELIDKFKARRTDFEMLVEMANQDRRLVRIASDFTWLDDNLNWPRPESDLGFSKDRWDQYRSLFVRLGLRGGLSRRTDLPQAIFLIAATKGISLGGSAKGYVYSTEPLSPVLNSLDDVSAPMRDRVPVYKKLDDNWYLYYEVGS